MGLMGLMGGTRRAAKTEGAAAVDAGSGARTQSMISRNGLYKGYTL